MYAVGGNLSCPQLIQLDVMEERTHAHGEFGEHLDRAIPKDLEARISAIVADAESAGQKAARLKADKLENCEGYLPCAPHQMTRISNDLIGTHTKAKKEHPNCYNHLAVWVGGIVNAIKNIEHIRKA